MREDDPLAHEVEWLEEADGAFAGGSIDRRQEPARVCRRCAAPVAENARFCSRCGAPLNQSVNRSPSDPVSDVQALLPARYLVLEFLGRGAMGRVFLCRDRELDVVVAVKVLAPELLSLPEEQVRMRREARTAARFRGCPGILSLYSFEVHKGTSFFVMEFAQGGSLRSYLSRCGRLDEPECLRVGAEIANALAFAHARGVAHRDIKPGNILFDAEQHVKIADFGLAKVSAEASSSTVDGIVGTPAYMAPEILSGARGDAQSDLYSLGCTLFEIATGALPFRGSFGEIAAEKLRQDGVLPDPRKLRCDLSAGFATLVERLLQRDPHKRFASTEDCVEAFAVLGQRNTRRRATAPRDKRRASAARALFIRAVSLQGSGAYDEAEQHLVRALEMHRQVFGEENAAVAQVLKYMARNFYLQERYAEAERPFLDALAIRERIRGANHIEVAHELTFLGRLYFLQRRFAAARLAYRRAVKILDACVGPGHLRVARVLLHLGDCHLAELDAAGADPVLGRALRIVRNARGESHPQYAELLTRVAAVHLHRHRYVKCEVALRKALTLLEQAYGESDGRILDALDLYAVLLSCTDRERLADAKRERAHQIRLQIATNGIGTT